MKTLLRFIALAAALVLLLVVGALVYVKLYVKPEDIKARISEVVQQQTGRSFTLEGDAHVSVFPWLGLEIGGISLGNAAGFGDEPMLSTGRAQVRVQLLPLLNRRVEMDTISITDARVQLIVDKNGKSNWADLVRAPATPSASGPAVGLESLALGGIDIRNARLAFDDRRTGSAYRLEGLNLNSGSIAPGRPVDLELSTTFDAKREQAAGSLKFRGEVQYDLTGRMLSVSSMKFETTLTRTPTGTTGTVAVDGDLRADVSGAQPKLALTPMDLRAKLTDVRPGLGADLTLKSALDADLGAQRIKLGAMEGSVQLSGSSLPGKSASATLRGTVDYDLGAGNVTVDNLLFDGLGATVKGSLKAAGLNGKRADVNGRFDVQAADLTTLMTLAGQRDLAQTVRSLEAQAVFGSGGQGIRVEPLQARAKVQNPALGKGPVDVTLSTQGTIDPVQQTLTLSNLAIKGLGLDVKGSLSVAAYGDAARRHFGGTLAVAPFDLRALMSTIGKPLPVTADPNVFRRTALDGKISGSGDSLSLAGLALTLDDSRIKGDLGVSHFASPALVFNLDVDALDADRYLPPRATADGAAPPADPATSAAVGTATAVPLDALRALRMKGQLRVGRLVISNLKLANVALAINAQDGDIRVAPVKADLYEGQYQGSIGINAAGKTAQLAIEQAVTGIQSRPLLTDLLGKSRLVGRGDFALSAKAVGNDTQSLKQTLNGSGRLLFRDGKLKGVNIGRLLRQAQKGFIEPVSAEEETDFAELSGSFTIMSGVIANEDLALKSPLLRVAGRGTASLPADQLDYTVDTTVVDTAEGQGGAELTSLSGLTIPIRITGSFADPKWAPDIGGIVKAQAEKQLAKQKEKVGEKVKEALQEKLGGGAAEGAAEAVKKLLNF